MFRKLNAEFLLFSIVFNIFYIVFIIITKHNVYKISEKLNFGKTNIFLKFF